MVNNYIPSSYLKHNAIILNLYGHQNNIFHAWSTSPFFLKLKVQGPAVAMVPTKVLPILSSSARSMAKREIIL